MTTCDICGKTIEICNEGGTGYGILDDGRKVCYKCCADMDRKDMIKNDKITLYLTKIRCKPTVTNWPGSLRFKVKEIKKSKQFVPNVGKTERTHVWFDGPDGSKWYGFQVGDNSELCYCTKLKQNP